MKQTTRLYNTQCVRRERKNCQHEKKLISLTFAFINAEDTTHTNEANNMACLHNFNNDIVSHSITSQYID